MQRYSFKVDGEYRRPTPDDAGAFYDVAIVDARIAELEKALLTVKHEVEGCGIGCTREFMRMGLDSVHSIASRALKL